MKVKSESEVAQSCLTLSDYYNEIIKNEIDTGDHGTVHALITWLSCTDHVTVHALMTWLFGH